MIISSFLHKKQAVLLNTLPVLYIKQIIPLLAAIGIVLAGAGPLPAQELNASVEVDRSLITGSTTNYVENLDDDIEKYLNQHDWIDEDLLPQERVEVSIQITLLSVDDNFNFEAEIAIRSRRPIYNAMRRTNVFRFNDEDWEFDYTPNRGMVHDELQFDRLTSLLDFYAYIILGYDFDTFSELGGSPYFSEADNIASLAQSTGAGGWSRSGGGVRRNRAQLISSLQNPGYAPLRRAHYTYHRQGLDHFIDEPAQARRSIITALQQVQTAQQNTTSDLLSDIFFDAKYREIVPIFEDAPTDVRLEAYNLLSRIDQSHLSTYRRLQ